MRIRASLPAALAFAVASVITACGLEMGGLQTAPTDGGEGVDGPASAEGGGSGSGSTSSSTSSGGGDSGGTSSSTSSGGSDATPNDGPSQQDSPPPQDTGSGCTAANGCYVIPGGWQLVAFAPQQGALCPPGFSNAPPTNLVEGPNTANACACTCQVKNPLPSCAAGAVQVHYDTKGLPGAGQCQSAGIPGQNNNSPAGMCATDMFHGPYDNLDLRFDPPAATGGTCSSASSTTGPLTYAALDSACQPDSNQSAGCTGNQCTPTIPSPYLVCVAKNGHQTCPGAPFTQQHDVGSSATVACGGSCGCNLTTTCTGTMQLFTDGMCKQGELDVVADGTCKTSTGVSGNYNSYKYVGGTASATCQSTGTATVQNVTLAGEQTICCTQ
jgi:hypothetical protein